MRPTAEVEVTPRLTDSSLRCVGGRLYVELWHAVVGVCQEYPCKFPCDADAGLARFCRQRRSRHRACRRARSARSTHAGSQYRQNFDQFRARAARSCSGRSQSCRQHGRRRSPRPLGAPVRRYSGGSLPHDRRPDPAPRSPQDHRREPDLRRARGAQRPRGIRPVAWRSWPVRIWRHERPTSATSRPGS